MWTFDLWPLDLVERNIHGLHSLQQQEWQKKHKIVDFCWFIPLWETRIGHFFARLMATSWSVSVLMIWGCWGHWDHWKWVKKWNKQRDGHRLTKGEFFTNVHLCFCHVRTLSTPPFLVQALCKYRGSPPYADFGTWKKPCYTIYGMFNREILNFLKEYV